MKKLLVLTLALLLCGGLLMACSSTGTPAPSSTSASVAPADDNSGMTTLDEADPVVVAIQEKYTELVSVYNNATGMLDGFLTQVDVDVPQEAYNQIDKAGELISRMNEIDLQSMSDDTRTELEAELDEMLAAVRQAEASLSTLQALPAADDSGTADSAVDAVE